MIRKRTVLGTARPGRTRVIATAEEMSRHAAFVGRGALDAARAVVEGFARSGRDVVVVDTEGAFLSLERLDREAWDAPVEVVPWTPASSLGIPLAANPLHLDFDADESVRADEIADVAEATTALLGWKPSVRDGKAVHGLLAAALEACHLRTLEPRDFSDLAAFLAKPPRPYGAAFRRLVSRELGAEIRARLEALDDGASRLLFTHGAPLDVPTLIGADKRRRPHVSVIALATLTSDEERGMLLVDLLHRLARWARRADEAVLPALCVGDASCVLPSAKRPVRDAARRFLRLARTTGMACVLATEAPASCDLAEMLRSAVVSIGSTDDERVAAAVAKRMPAMAADIAAARRGLREGEAVVVAGGVLTAHVGPRRSTSARGRLRPADLGALIDPAERRRFEDAGRALARARATRTIAEQLGGAAASPDRAELLLGLDAGEPRNAYDAARRERLAGALAFLREARRLVTADDVAAAIGATRAGAMRVLRELVGVGLAARVRDGSGLAYHAAELAWHPRAGLLEMVERAPTLVSRDEAVAAAEKSVDRLLFFFERETVATDRVRCVHFPLWRCHFVGFRRAGILRKLTTSTADVYLHPAGRQLCVLSKSRGFRFVTPDWQRNPVAIRDVDDITGFERGPAKDVALARWALDEMTTERDASKRFTEIFHLDAEVSLVFLPVWEVTLESKGDDGVRIVHVDAVVGKAFEP